MIITSILAIFSLLTTSSGALTQNSQSTGVATSSAMIHATHSRSTVAILGRSNASASERMPFVAILDDIVITAYSSTPDQTDDSPFIMASGKHVYDGAIAANFLPFGTLVRLPDLFGEKIFVVEDRMNRRYSKRMDIWMEKTSDARIFGLKRSRVEILTSTDIHN